MHVRFAPKATVGSKKNPAKWGHPLAGLVQHSAGLHGVVAAQRPTGLGHPTNPKVTLALRSSVTTITKERISPPSSHWSANLSFEGDVRYEAAQVHYAARQRQRRALADAVASQ